MVDSIKVYVKTKEGFGWPEDAEDFAGGTGSEGTKVPSTQLSSGGASMSSGGAAGDGVGLLPAPLTPVDRLLASALEVLDGMFATQQAQQEVVSAGCVSWW